MDLTAFYATVSGVGFTLLGLWWVVVDKHPEWFEDRSTSLMAYVVSLHFMIPATSSLLSLVAPDKPVLWRVVFSLTGLSGMYAAWLVSRAELGGSRFAKVVLIAALPVYLLVVLVALVPDVGSVFDLTGLQAEALLTAAILLIGLHGAWFFGFQSRAATKAS